MQSGLAKWILSPTKLLSAINVFLNSHKTHVFMTLMDPNKIFGLFEGEEPGILQEKAQADNALLDYKDTPIFWVGMFKKLILNNRALYVQIQQHLSPEVLNEMPGMDDMAEFVTYNRAWYYISKLDIKQKYHADSVKTFTDDNLLFCLKSAIKYFENREEYEKCAHMKKIQDKVEKFLTKA